MGYLRTNSCGGGVLLLENEALKGQLNKILTSNAVEYVIGKYSYGGVWTSYNTNLFSISENRNTLQPIKPLDIFGYFVGYLTYADGTTYGEGFLQLNGTNIGVFSRELSSRLTTRKYEIATCVPSLKRILLSTEDKFTCSFYPGKYGDVKFSLYGIML